MSSASRSRADHIEQFDFNVTFGLRGGPVQAVWSPKMSTTTRLPAWCKATSVSRQLLPQKPALALEFSAPALSTLSDLQHSSTLSAWGDIANASCSGTRVTAPDTNQRTLGPFPASRLVRPKPTWRRAAIESTARMLRGIILFTGADAPSAPTTMLTPTPICIHCSLTRSRSPLCPAGVAMAT